MFDLVIVDEATQVDQIAAAPALLRGRRCVVAGDTRQLRHVSFTSDQAIRSALDAAGITDATDAARLDVRRMSLFDLAATAAPRARARPALPQRATPDLVLGASVLRRQG